MNKTKYKYEQDEDLRNANQEWDCKKDNKYKRKLNDDDLKDTNNYTDDDIVEENKSIDIPMSEQDLEELLHDEGTEFNWTFDGVNVRIFKGDEEDE